MIQPHTKWCNADTILKTIDQCKSAKAVFDPKSTVPVKIENFAKAPRGCTRFQGNWFFNTNLKGELDGASEPICKAKAGILTQLEIAELF